MNLRELAMAALESDVAYDSWQEALGPQDHIDLLDRIAALEAQNKVLVADAARLDWIQRHLFVHKWNGVIDSGSQTRWGIWSGYRHETQHLIGNTFADAIDNAIAAQKGGV